MLLRQILIALLLSVLSCQLYLYETEHMLLDLHQYIGHSTYEYQGATCNTSQPNLIEVNDVIKKQPVVNSSQDWPDAPIIKTKLFESGNLSLKTGVFLTSNTKLYVFSDSTLNLLNVSRILFKEQEIQLPYDNCSDISIVNEFLMTLCSQNNTLFLDTFNISSSDGHYHLSHHNNHTLISQSGDYQLENNKDYMALFKRGIDSIYLYKFNISTLVVQYLGILNMTDLYGTSCWIVDVTFPFNEETDETQYLNVLTKNQGLLIVMIDQSGSYILLQHFNIVPYDEYIGMYKQADVDIDQVRIFLITNFFIINTQISYSSDQVELIIIEKQLLPIQLMNVTRYQADQTYYYCVAFNIQQKTLDLLIVDRKTMTRRIHIHNLTGTFLTYQSDNVVFPSLKNRLRVLTHQNNKTRIETYTFYSHIVNITAMELNSSSNVHCTLHFDKNDTLKNITLTILNHDYWSLSFIEGTQLNSKYVSLQNTKYLNQFVVGPAPSFTVVNATSNLISHQLHDRYMVNINLQQNITLKMPLLYCRLMSVEDDDAANQQIGIIVIQDSDMKLVLYSIITIGDELQEITLKQFSPGRQVKQCSNFQQIVVVSYVDNPSIVYLFSVDSTNINLIEEYEPTVLINSTDVSYHFKTIPLFPKLICIIQAQTQMQLEIRNIPSKYSSFTLYKKLPETVSVFTMPDIYKQFIVDFLSEGVIIGKTHYNSYHLVNIDLYMGKGAKILSKHQTIERSRILFGMDQGFTRPIVVELRDGKATTFQILCLDAQPGFVFGVGKQLPNFSFQFSQSGLLYLTNGVVLIEATNNGKSYILAYKLQQNNYNSLLAIIEKTSNDYFDYVEFTSDSYQKHSYCIPSINSSMVLTIECRVSARLNTLMKSKSPQHVGKVCLNYSNFFQNHNLSLVFSLDFIYEDIRLEARTQQLAFNPKTDTLSLQSLFYGPIQSCTIHDQPIGYLNDIGSKQFRINDMCQHLSNNYRKKVNSKSWVLLLCSSGVYIIQNTNNNTTKFSNETLLNVWGNPVRQFETLDKWVIVGVGQDGFKTYLKETAGWKGEFQSFQLVQDDNSTFKYDITSDRSILQWFVFYDIDRQLKLDFVLFRGFTNRQAVDRTIGIYLCQNETADSTHHKIYEITAKDINVSRLDASHLNVSCVKYSQSYHLVMTFKSMNRYVVVVHMTLTNNGITINSIGQIDMGQIIRQADVIPHHTSLFEYQILVINEQYCNLILTSDFVIVGVTINLSTFQTILTTVYSDYMGCKNQEMANQFGSLVILTCKFQHQQDIYIKAYHKYNNSIVNITQFMKLPSEINNKDYIDKIGYAYNVLQYGILSQSPPLFDTNFTYNYIRINTSLQPVESQHFPATQLCCTNQFNKKCINIIEDIKNQTAFWLLIFTPICMAIVMLVGGVIYIKNYKQQMNHWAELYNREHMKDN